MISALTPGCVASQAPRQVRILELGLRIRWERQRGAPVPVATGLGANAAPSSEEVAEVVDEGRVAESDSGLGGQA